MIDLTGAQPGWSPEASGLWLDCVTAASRDERLWNTPAPQGDELLREQIGGYFGLDPQLLTITSGIRAAALTYARLHRVIQVECPSFAGAVRVLEFAGSRVERRAWPQLGARPGSAALWVTSPCRNPDGATLGAAEREQLARRAAAGQRVIVNGAYLWYAPHAPGVPGADLLGSLHKIGGHSCRLGWVYSASYFEQSVAELLGTTPSPVWQRAWGRFASRGGLELLASRCQRAAREAAEAFAAELGRHDLLAPPSPHLLLPLAAGVTEDRALSELEQRGYLLSPGRDFGSGQPALRVSFLGASRDAAAGLARTVRELSIFEWELRRAACCRK